MRHFFLLLALGGVFISSCERNASSGLSDDLVRAIREAATDGVITTVECAYLRNQSRTENPDVTHSPEEWNDILRGNLPRGVEEVTIDCPAANDTKPDNATGTACSSNPAMVNLYVENSRSMYGYLSTGGSFQQVMLDYIVKFDKMDQPFEAAFINNEVFPVDEQAGEYKGAKDIFKRKRHFESYLDAGKMDKLGNTGSSKLMKILDVVTDRAVNDCHVQLLVSDYVYSLSGVNDMKSEMAGIRSDMELLIGKVKDAGLGTLVIKYESKFDGRFYPWNSPNKGFMYKGSRPYYVWVFGAPNYLKTFVNDYALNTQNGYKESVLYLPGQKDEPAYGIFPNSGNPRGEFRKSPLKANPVLALSDVAASERRGQEGLRFALGVDLLKYPVTRSYFRNVDNYRIVGPDEENWHVAEIMSLSDGLSDRDQRLVSTTNPTHFIILEADDVESKTSTLKVQFLNRKVAWLAQSHTDDDSESVIDNMAGKTFGFAYLSDGIWSAYHGAASEQYFFTIPLTLER